MKEKSPVNKTEDGNFQSPPAQAPQPKGALDEARSLFEKMAGEAGRQAERQQKDARARGPVAKILLALTLTACLFAAVTGIYGIYYFPDAPIRQTESGGYVGKVGKPHTREEFEAFTRWKQAMVIAFPSALAFGLAFAIAENLGRRKRAA